MAKGSIGTQTNTIIHIKKIKPIPCDCNKCIHRKTRGTIKYCSYYDIFSPNKNFCSRYGGTKVKNKTRKKSNSNMI